MSQTLRNAVHSDAQRSRAALRERLAIADACDAIALDSERVERAARRDFACVIALFALAALFPICVALSHVVSVATLTFAAFAAFAVAVLCVSTHAAR